MIELPYLQHSMLLLIRISSLTLKYVLCKAFGITVGLVFQNCCCIFIGMTSLFRSGWVINLCTTYTFCITVYWKSIFGLYFNVSKPIYCYMKANQFDVILSTYSALVNCQEFVTNIPLTAGDVTHVTVYPHHLPHIQYGSYQILSFTYLNCIEQPNFFGMKKHLLDIYYSWLILQLNSCKLF